MKKQYKSPHIKMVKVQMEADIALGSAKVYPYNNNGEVYESWEQEPDDSRNIDW
jgi:hypothetical protein